MKTKNNGIETIIDQESAQELLWALKNIVWKLDRNETYTDEERNVFDSHPAKIDRRDIVIRDARKAIARAIGA